MIHNPAYNVKYGPMVSTSGTIAGPSAQPVEDITSVGVALAKVREAGSLAASLRQKADELGNRLTGFALPLPTPAITGPANLKEFRPLVVELSTELATLFRELRDMAEALDRIDGGL